ncbi:serine protease SPPA, chloroplastic [Oryza glaberrima]|uniref:Peptidase S49 domain-containing protein n=1 Tax=Oryza glaberrima TaxID=4538 RepID=I1P3U8_ORYGL|nr:serine protease SPPA, chloroplastic [Oryza glaberrima]
MARLLVLRSAPYHRSHLSATATFLLSPSNSKHPHSASASASFPSTARRILLPSPLRVPARAIESSPGTTKQEPTPAAGEGEAQEPPPPAASAFEVEELGWGTQLAVKLRMLVAPPWKRVRKGSVLNMKLRGEISDQLKTRFSSGLSLPQICENFVKAAYDPRISGIYLHIEPLRCGWGKVDEIRRHIVDFKKSGKFVVGYMPVCGEKEYYLACACGELYAPPSAYVALFGLTVQQTFLRGVLEKVGIEPEIQRIGRYKSAGDQLARKSMSNEVREMLATLLDNIYGNWLDTISSNHGKKKEEIEEFINSGVYQVARLKEEGWITDLLYDDEVMAMLKERVGQKDKKSLRMVDYSKYSRVSKWTLGLQGGGEQIAVIRASGSITRTRSPLSVPSSGIIAEQLIEKIRTVRESEKYKAVILRIDSPGGDALASDLMWREIRLLADTKPVVASMSDVAASGGYYMAMAAPVIVAEKLTLTGSIGVVTGKFILQKLYERIDFNKEIISKGRYAELNAADQRPLRPDEAELFEKSAQNAYALFRDKAAMSRSMNVDQMETVAQGRVWSGQDAASRGLVDSLGGFSQALAIAKQKANIPHDRKVQLVEISKPSPTLPEILSGIGSSLLGVDRAVKGVLQDVTSLNGVQARMDGILFERLEDLSGENQLLLLVKDIVNYFD